MKEIRKKEYYEQERFKEMACKGTCFYDDFDVRACLPK
jgi:hypothetical protein